MMAFLSTRGRAVPAGGLALGLMAFGPAGCGGNSSGPSDFEKATNAQQDRMAALTAAGVKATEKRYPVGVGWVVDCRGATVTDDLLRKVKDLGNVAELNLSGTNVTDDHLRTAHAINLHGALGVLDLSNTGVTDAVLAELDGNVYLFELNLKGTKVTPAAVDRFRKARQADPRVKIKTTKIVL